jgi:hypothetical protein
MISGLSGSMCGWLGRAEVPEWGRQLCSKWRHGQRDDTTKSSTGVALVAPEPGGLVGAVLRPEWMRQIRPMCCFARGGNGTTP